MHLVQVSEKGKFTQEFFNRHGELRHIKKLRFWSLDNVLEEKYRVPRHEVSAATCLWSSTRTVLAC